MVDRDLTMPRKSYKRVRALADAHDADVGDVLSIGLMLLQTIDDDKRERARVRHGGRVGVPSRRAPFIGGRVASKSRSSATRS